MKNTANLLIVTGGGLILIPFAYLYFIYRFSTQLASELVAHGDLEPNVKFTPVLPEYYIPICLLLGIACIGIGVFFAWRETNADKFTIDAD